MIKILVAIAAMYGTIVALAWAFQSRLLYLPSIAGRSVTATPADRGWRYEEIRLNAEDGVRIAGWWLPHDEPRATLLFFHGNAGNIGHRLDSLQLFRQLNLSVLIVDYRGYGESEGSPSEAGIRMDARAAWNYLTLERRIPAREIVVFGRSLGGAVAAHLAREHRPAALIVESAFRSAPEMAQSAYPFLPARWLTRFDYATENYVREVDAPVLVIHGTADEIIPYAHGLAVYEAAREPKRMLELQGGHNTGFLESSERYVNGIDAFLREVAGL
jgi:uncharacterized protein